MHSLSMVFVFVLSGFLGFELISRVPSQLHTPLMSGSNAISGITIIGAVVALGNSGGSKVAVVLGFFATVLATINVVSGYCVTDRMLEMFAGKKNEKKSIFLNKLQSTESQTVRGKQ